MRESLSCPANSLFLQIFKINILLRQLLKILSRIILGLLALVLLVWLLIQTEPVQNFIVNKITKRLSKDLKTEVSVKHVSIGLFDRIDLQGALIKDLNKDTLVYAETLKARLTDWFFLKDTLVLKYVGLEDAKINLYRNDSIWNYQFLADYFSPAKKPSQKKKSGIQFNLQKIDFKNVSFVQHDNWVGQNIDVSFNSLTLDADNFNLEKNIFEVKEIDLVKPVFSIKNFTGLRPASYKKKPRADTGYYFNTGNLQLKIATVNIANGTLISEGETDQKNCIVFRSDAYKVSKDQWHVCQPDVYK